VSLSATCWSLSDETLFAGVRDVYAADDPDAVGAEDSRRVWVQCSARVSQSSFACDLHLCFDKGKYELLIFRARTPDVLREYTDRIAEYSTTGVRQDKLRFDLSLVGVGPVAQLSLNEAPRPSECQES
jgi:hypothetical protein